jgi:hypothetical protein
MGNHAAAFGSALLCSIDPSICESSFRDLPQWQHSGVLNTFHAKNPNLLESKSATVLKIMPCSADDSMDIVFNFDQLAVRQRPPFSKGLGA